MVEDRKKVAEDHETEAKKTDAPKDGILVGPAFDFLFEGDNNEYDGQYSDYI